jgi:hypothetical protein
MSVIPFHTLQPTEQMTDIGIVHLIRGIVDGAFSLITRVPLIVSPLFPISTTVKSVNEGRASADACRVGELIYIQTDSQYRFASVIRNLAG